MIKDEVAIAMGVALLLAIYVYSRGVTGAASDAGKAAVKTVGGALVGGVVGLGDVLGVPETNAAQCQQDITNGDTWGSATSCDVPTFFKNLF